MSSLQSLQCATLGSLGFTDAPFLTRGLHVTTSNGEALTDAWTSEDLSAVPEMVSTFTTGPGRRDVGSQVGAGWISQSRDFALNGDSHWVVLSKQLESGAEMTASALNVELYDALTLGARYGAGSPWAGLRLDHEVNIAYAGMKFNPNISYQALRFEIPDHLGEAVFNGFVDVTGELPEAFKPHGAFFLGLCVFAQLAESRNTELQRVGLSAEELEELHHIFTVGHKDALVADLRARIQANPLSLVNKKEFSARSLFSREAATVPALFRNGGYPDVLSLHHDLDKHTLTMSQRVELGRAFDPTIVRLYERFIEIFGIQVKNIL